MTLTFTNADILDRLNWRYATKLFDPSRSISAEDWRALLESLRLAPSSFGLQPWRFLVIDSDAMRKRLAEAAPLNRAKLESASRIVVLARLKTVSTDYLNRYFDRVAVKREIPRTDLRQYQDMVAKRITGMSDEAQTEWTARQAYLALGTFLTSAALLQIDACPMEGIDPGMFDEILGLSDTDYATVATVAAGYRSTDDRTQFAPKVRFGHNEVFATL